MDDAEFQQLLDASAPLTLVGSGKSFLPPFLCVLFLAIVSFYLAWLPPFQSYRVHIIPSNVAGEFGVFIFGSLSLLYLAILLFPSSLTLNQEGFKVKQVHRVETYTWKDVTAFTTSAGVNLFANASSPQAGQGDRSNQNKTGKILLVLFDVATKTDRSEQYRALTGYGGILTNRFNVSTEQLAQLMNHWRERYLSKS